jgi:hypothetical protein
MTGFVEISAANYGKRKVSDPWTVLIPQSKPFILFLPSQLPKRFLSPSVFLWGVRYLDIRFGAKPGTSSFLLANP